VVFEEFDGDLVVLDLSTGRYFGFNQTATLLWRALIDGAAPADIVTAAPDLPGVAEFVEKLVGHGLLIASDAVAQQGWASEALAQSNTAPTVDLYDDLADLILSDPIHDVDAESGWPKTRTA
jgi:hypothetical protein